MGSNIDSDTNNYMTLGKTIFLRLNFFICKTGTSNKVVLNEKNSYIMLYVVSGTQ